MASPEWQIINDFSPGCHTVTTTTLPKGAASDEGTFRCMSIEGGALVPAPRMSQTIPMDMSVLHATPDELLDGEYRIVGLNCRGPLFMVGEQAPNGGEGGLYHNEIMVGLEYWVEKPGDDFDYRHFQILRYRDNAAGEWEEIWHHVTEEGPWQSITRAVARFEVTRSNSTDPGIAGTVVVCFSIGQRLRMYPDDTDPGGTGTVALPGDGVLGGEPSIAAHQARMVLFPLMVTESGFESLWATNEQLSWTSVNNLTELDPALADNYFQVVPNNTTPAGFSCMQSLTADELLLIKQSGGAIMLRGDLNGYTAVNYPYVRSTNESLNRGIVSPVGFVYPVNDSGIWLWTGGQTSEHITKHLAANFWQPTPGLGWSQMGSWGTWVTLPNNWLWDTDSGNWWVLEDPTVVTSLRWAEAYNAVRAFATPRGFADGNDPVVYVWYRNEPCSSYQWTSQPMSESADHEIRIGEVVVVGSGRGTIRVRAFTGENPVGVFKDFEVSTDAQRPKPLRQKMPVSGSEVTFEVISTSAVDGEPAPTLHELRYSVVPVNKVKNS